MRQNAFWAEPLYAMQIRYSLCYNFYSIYAILVFLMTNNASIKWLTTVGVVTGLIFLWLYSNTRWFAPDFSEKHEYIRVQELDKNNTPIEGKAYSLSEIIILTSRFNHYPIGQEKCARALNGLSEEVTGTALSSHYAARSSDGVSLQCVEYLGMSEQCEDAYTSIVKTVLDIDSNNSAEDIAIAMAVLTFDSHDMCQIINPIGNPRRMSLFR
jgi:hypothetical protein